MLVLAALVLFAGSASAINIGVADSYARMNAVASYLALDLGMSQAGLAAFWSGQVDKLGDLPPVVATVNNPERLNNQLGTGATIKKGDFAALSPFANGQGTGYGVTFFGKEYDKSSPKLMINIGVEDFYSTAEKAGLRIVGKPGNFVPNFLLATIADPAAFNSTFSGKGTAARGQMVVLKPGDKGTTAFLGSGMPVRRFVVSEGKVSEIK